VYLQHQAGHPDRAFGKRSAGVLGCVLGDANSIPFAQKLQHYFSMQQISGRADEQKFGKALFTEALHGKLSRNCASLGRFACIWCADSGVLSFVEVQCQAIGNRRLDSTW
jgi:hypothetical protein